MNELKETWFGLTIDRFIDAAVSEDLGEGDLTSLATIAKGQTVKTGQVLFTLAPVA
jgi:nicotinate-nucleotide pyrophosphorylase